MHVDFGAVACEQWRIRVCFFMLRRKTNLLGALPKSKWLDDVWDISGNLFKDSDPRQGTWRLISGLRKKNLDLKRIDCVCVSSNKSKSRTRPFNVPDFSLSFFMSSTALRRTSLSPSWTSSCRNNLVGMETRIISCNMPNTEVRV